jgi:predicted DNA-binding transcriptional regulator AlpA
MPSPTGKPARPNMSNKWSWPAQSLTNHVLLRPIEVAAMLGTTRKTLREMEARGELPPRVSFSPKVFGWRLADMEALIREKMGAAA